MNEVAYSPSLKITNVEALPGGLGCKYLLAIRAVDGSLIAKQWKRKRPAALKPGEVLVVFP